MPPDVVSSDIRLWLAFHYLVRQYPFLLWCLLILPLRSWPFSAPNNFTHVKPDLFFVLLVAVRRKILVILFRTAAAVLVWYKAHFVASDSASLLSLAMGKKRSVYTSDLAWHWCAKSSRGNHMLLLLPPSRHHLSRRHRSTPPQASPPRTAQRTSSYMYDDAGLPCRFLGVHVEPCCRAQSDTQLAMLWVDESHVFGTTVWVVFRYLLGMGAFWLCCVRFYVVGWLLQWLGCVCLLVGSQRSGL